MALSRHGPFISIAEVVLLLGIVVTTEMLMCLAACNRNYHNNFYVHNGHRTYYHGIPDYSQVSEHHFVERRLAELWTNQHLMGA